MATEEATDQSHDRRQKHVFGRGWLLFLADGSFLFAIRDLAPSGDVPFPDEENGIGSGYAVFDGTLFSNALGETTKIVGHALKPKSCVRSVH